MQPFSRRLNLGQGPRRAATAAPADDDIEDDSDDGQPPPQPPPPPAAAAAAAEEKEHPVRCRVAKRRAASPSHLCAPHRSGSSEARW